MKFVVTIGISLLLIVILFWQFMEVESRRSELSKKVDLQNLQIKLLEQERDDSKKKLDNLIADLKGWADKNQTSLSAKQYSTFTDCNARVGGGFSCFSY